MEKLFNFFDKDGNGKLNTAEKEKMVRMARESLERENAAKAKAAAEVTEPPLSRVLSSPYPAPASALALITTPVSATKSTSVARPAFWTNSRATGNSIIS